eukprot:157793_1
MAQENKPKTSREEEITRIVLTTKKTSFKDLPRISKRINIINNTENKNVTLIRKGNVESNQEEKKDKSDDLDNRDVAKASNWKRITNILLCLAQQCVFIDKTDRNVSVHNTLKQVLNEETNNKRTDQYDQELKRLFESNKIDECQVIRILNGCNQNVIFGAFYQLLKEYFIPNGFNGMKDVRTEFGWEIFIYFNPKGIVRILHKRQTQYAQPPNELAKHFLVNWELDMSFTPRLTKCNAVFVRVSGIEFNEAVDSKYKSDINTKLSGADLIFH